MQPQKKKKNAFLPPTLWHAITYYVHYKISTVVCNRLLSTAASCLYLSPHQPASQPLSSSSPTFGLIYLEYEFLLHLMQWNIFLEEFYPHKDRKDTFLSAADICCICICFSCSNLVNLLPILCGMNLWNEVEAIEGSWMARRRVTNTHTHRDCENCSFWSGFVWFFFVCSFEIGLPFFFFCVHLFHASMSIILFYFLNN